MARGILSQTIRTPRDGRVIAIGGGQILLETGETTLQLRAGIPGTVVQVPPVQDHPTGHETPHERTGPASGRSTPHEGHA